MEVRAFFMAPIVRIVLASSPETPFCSLLCRRGFLTLSIIVIGYLPC